MVKILQNMDFSAESEDRGKNHFAASSIQDSWSVNKLDAFDKTEISIV